MPRHVWNTWSIRAKLLLSIMLVLTATVSASGGLFYLSSVATIERRTLALTSNTVHQMTKNADLYITGIERLSGTIAGDATVQSVLSASNPPTRDQDRGRLPDKDDVTFRFLTLLASWPSIQGMYLFANDGRLFYATRGQLPADGYSVDQEPWYRNMLRQAAPSVLLWPTGRESSVGQQGQPVFSHIRLVKNISSGRRLGYLKIDINVAAMHDLLGLAERPDRDAQVLLVADDGHVVYDSAGDLTGKRAEGLDRTPADHPQNRLLWRDKTYLYAAQRSQHTGWTTWMLIPAETITSESRQVGVIVLLLCAAALLVIGTVLYIVTQRVTRPLRLIAQTMARVEQGDLAVRVPIPPARDEIWRLSRVFNTMLDSLEHLITEVYEAQLREKDAQLLALQTQINPHFLFNTLNSMRALSRKQHADLVATIAEALAELFRYCMSNWNQPVPLHEELAHVANYVTIQRARFGARFTFDCDVPAELLEAPVVKLSIQPLVENAITHGLDRRHTGLCIIVRVRRHEMALHIEVADNGYGVDAETLARLEETLARPTATTRLPTSDVGIGIVNIDRRIKLLFGEQYGVVIKVDPNVGTVVSLHVPYRGGSAAPAEAQGHEYLCR